MLTVNREKTKQINMALQANQCECEDCQWFYKYMEQFAPEKMRSFFDKIGIDLQKCQELWAYYPNDNGISHYSGYFLIAVNDISDKSGFQISEEWEKYKFDSLCFRLRAELTLKGEYILGFEADLPVKV